MLLVCVAVLVLVVVLLLHYRQHFKIVFQSPCKAQLALRNDSIQSILPTQMRIIANSKRRCCCIIISIDNEDFNFYPLCFMFYIIFLIILCSLIIIIDLLNYFNNDNKEDIIDLFFGYSSVSYHNNSILKLHNDNNTNVIFLFDYILIYGVMTLLIWESLLSFYPYYTNLSSTQFTNISAQDVIKKFLCYYVIIFCVLYSIQMHFFYYTFPIIILLHVIFNGYCIIKFASVLISNYKMFIDQTDSFAENTVNKEILDAVYLMKYISIICCILQSIYFSIFVITYNIDIIYYLPLIWSISCSIYWLKFVRNRRYVRHLYISFKQQLKKVACCDKKKRYVNNQENKDKNIAFTEDKVTRDILINPSEYDYDETEPHTPTTTIAGTYHSLDKITKKQNQRKICMLKRQKSAPIFGTWEPKIDNIYLNKSVDYLKDMDNDFNNSNTISINISDNPVPAKLISQQSEPVLDLYPILDIPKSNSSPMQTPPANDTTTLLKPIPIIETEMKQIIQTPVIRKHKVKAFDLLGITPTPTLVQNDFHVKKRISLSDYSNANESKYSTSPDSLTIPQPSPISNPPTNVMGNLKTFLKKSPQSIKRKNIEQSVSMLNEDLSSQYNMQPLTDMKYQTNDKDDIIICIDENKEVVGDDVNISPSETFSSHFTKNSILNMKRNSSNIDKKMMSSFNKLIKNGFFTRKSINSVKEIKNYQTQFSKQLPKKKSPTHDTNTLDLNKSLATSKLRINISDVNKLNQSTFPHTNTSDNIEKTRNSWTIKWPFGTPTPN